MSKLITSALLFCFFVLSRFCAKFRNEHRLTPRQVWCSLALRLAARRSASASAAQNLPVTGASLSESRAFAEKRRGSGLLRLSRCQASQLVVCAAFKLSGFQPASEEESLVNLKFVGGGHSY
eukprot:284805-Rhodomonas_salina.1